MPPVCLNEFQWSHTLEEESNNLLPGPGVNTEDWVDFLTVHFSSTPSLTCPHASDSPPQMMNNVLYQYATARYPKFLLLKCGIILMTVVLFVIIVSLNHIQEGGTTGVTWEIQDHYRPGLFLFPFYVGICFPSSVLPYGHGWLTGTISVTSVVQAGRRSIKGKTVKIKNNVPSVYQPPLKRFPETPLDYFLLYFSSHLYRKRRARNTF